jgi:hypothetical protein
VHNQYKELPPVGRAHSRVTAHPVKRSVFPQALKNAPGRDNLSFGAIRRFRIWDNHRIMRLMKDAIRTGRDSSVWKWACGVVIRKPGKDDSTRLKADRSL